jgi:hypothetical protein
MIASVGVVVVLQLPKEFRRKKSILEFFLRLFEKGVNTEKSKFGNEFKIFCQIFFQLWPIIQFWTQILKKMAPWCLIIITNNNNIFNTTNNNFFNNNNNPYNNTFNINILNSNNSNVNNIALTLAFSNGAFTFAIFARDFALS